MDTYPGDHVHFYRDGHGIDSDAFGPDDIDKHGEKVFANMGFKKINFLSKDVSIEKTYVFIDDAIIEVNAP